MSSKPGDSSTSPDTGELTKNGEIEYGLCEYKRFTLEYPESTGRRCECNIKSLKIWHDDYQKLDGDKRITDSEAIKKIGSLCKIDNNDALDNQTIHRSKSFSLAKIDHEAFEKDVSEYKGKVTVLSGFCVECQELFDNWPRLWERLSSPQPSEPIDSSESSNSPELTDYLVSSHNSDDSSEITESSGSDSAFPGYHAVSTRQFRIHEIVAGTTQGCQLCSLIRQGLVDADLLETFREIETRLNHFTQDSKITLTICHSYQSSKEQYLCFTFPGKLCTGSSTASVKILSRPKELDPSLFQSKSNQRVESVYLSEVTTLRNDVYSCARLWLKQCSENHKLCHVDSVSRPPTRLVDVYCKPPLLVHTTDWRVSHPYATLSHCWGNEPILTLTTHNLDSFTTSIPIEQLPKTFVDAIEITENLGLRYIWIDSLCIVQDSNSDWEREAGLMSNVYSGTAINIAASSARDGTQGCFLRPPYLTEGFEAQVKLDGPGKIRDFQLERAYTRAVTKSHLASRAWTLQEKLLSHRTLHIGTRGAFWECIAEVASEFLPFGLINNYAQSLLVCQRKHREQRGQLPSYLMEWNKIVFQYSQAHLTKEKDKLPALSGIARRLCEESKDRYLASLWRRTIEKELFWRSKHPALRRPLYRAPSWSWASVDTIVFPHPYNFNFVVKFTHCLDADINLHGIDPFGQVTGGVVRLACSVMAEGMFASPSTITIDDCGEKKECEIHLDCLEDYDRSSSDMVYLLPLVEWHPHSEMDSSRSDDDSEDTMIICGVLLQKTNELKGEFRRVGAFWFAQSDFWLFVNHLASRGMEVVEDVCADIFSNAVFPDEKYIITIV